MERPKVPPNLILPNLEGSSSTSWTQAANHAEGPRSLPVGIKHDQVTLPLASLAFTIVLLATLRTSRALEHSSFVRPENILPEAVLD